MFNLFNLDWLLDKVRVRFRNAAIRGIVEAGEIIVGEGGSPDESLADLGRRLAGVTGHKLVEADGAEAPAALIEAGPGRKKAK